MTIVASVCMLVLCCIMSGVENVKRTIVSSVCVYINLFIMSCFENVKFTSCVSVCLCVLPCRTNSFLILPIKKFKHMKFILFYVLLRFIFSDYGRRGGLHGDGRGGHEPGHPDGRHRQW